MTKRRNSGRSIAKGACRTLSDRWSVMSRERRVATYILIALLDVLSDDVGCGCDGCRLQCRGHNWSGHILCWYNDSDMDGNGKKEEQRRRVVMSRPEEVLAGEMK